MQTKSNWLVYNNIPSDTQHS